MLCNAAEQRPSIYVLYMNCIYYRSQASQELSYTDNINAAIVSLSDDCQGAWAQAVQAAVLAVCEEFAFVSLSLNPGLTHAILISLPRDNHDPERERERERGAQIHIGFSSCNDFFQFSLWCYDFLRGESFFFSFDVPANVNILSIVAVKCNERAIINCKIMKIVYDVKKWMFFYVEGNAWSHTNRNVKRNLPFAKPLPWTLCI